MTWIIEEINDNGAEELRLQELTDWRWQMEQVQREDHLRFQD